MTQYIFGSGSMYATPLQDATGAAIANPTPVKLGELQEASFDFSGEVKELYGQNKFPAAVGTAKCKASLKIKNARIMARAWNALFFGQTLQNGIIGVNTDTTGQTIPTTPFQIMVAPPSSGTFAADLGVLDANGSPMTRVASAPATGQYSVNTSTGQYTFAAADTGKVVYINYRYTASSTSAFKLSILNQAMGYQPQIGIDLSVIYQGKQAHFALYQCVAPKMSIALKNDDFAIPEFELAGMDNGTGIIGTLSTSE